MKTQFCLYFFFFLKIISNGNPSAVAQNLRESPIQIPPEVQTYWDQDHKYSPYTYAKRVNSIFDSNHKTFIEFQNQFNLTRDLAFKLYSEAAKIQAILDNASNGLPSSSVGPFGPNYLGIGLTSIFSELGTFKFLALPFSLRITEELGLLKKQLSEGLNPETRRLSIFEHEIRFKELVTKSEQVELNDSEIRVARFHAGILFRNQNLHQWIKTLIFVEQKIVPQLEKDPLPNLINFLLQWGEVPNFPTPQAWNSPVDLLENLNESIDLVYTRAIAHTSNPSTELAVRVLEDLSINLKTFSTELRKEEQRFQSLIEFKSKGFSPKGENVALTPERTVGSLGEINATDVPLRFEKFTKVPFSREFISRLFKFGFWIIHNEQHPRLAYPPGHPSGLHDQRVLSWVLFDLNYLCSSALLAHYPLTADNHQNPTYEILEKILSESIFGQSEALAQEQNKLTDIYHRLSADLAGIQPVKSQREVLLEFLRRNAELSHSFNEYWKAKYEFPNENSALNLRENILQTVRGLNSSKSRDSIEILVAPFLGDLTQSSELFNQAWNQEFEKTLNTQLQILFTKPISDTFGKTKNNSNLFAYEIAEKFETPLDCLLLRWAQHQMTHFLKTKLTDFAPSKVEDFVFLGLGDIHFFGDVEERKNQIEEFILSVTANKYKWTLKLDINKDGRVDSIDQKMLQLLDQIIF